MLAKLMLSGALALLHLYYAVEVTLYADWFPALVVYLSLVFIRLLAACGRREPREDEQSRGWCEASCSRRAHQLHRSSGPHQGDRLVQ